MESQRPVNRPSLAISIPAYNEEAALPGVLQASQEVLSSLTDDWEIVIINDGSRDATGAVADRFARENSRIKVFHHPQNQGFGPTLREVFTRPTKEWIFFIPGDGQIHPSQLKTLWAGTSRAEFILGWRVDRQDPINRRINAGVYNLLVSSMLGRRIHDVDSVALFQRDVAQRITLESQSVFIHAEFLMKSVQAGARWLELPIEHRPRQGGKALGSNLSVIFKTFGELMRFALSSKDNK